MGPSRRTPPHQFRSRSLLEVVAPIWHHGRSIAPRWPDGRAAQHTAGLSKADEHPSAALIVMGWAGTYSRLLAQQLKIFNSKICQCSTNSQREDERELLWDSAVCAVSCELRTHRADMAGPGTRLPAHDCTHQLH